MRLFNLPNVFAFAFLGFLLSACEAPIDAALVAEQTARTQADSAMLADFSRLVGSLQQLAPEDDATARLARQIARLPQNVQQKILVTQPDSLLSILPSIDSSNSALPKDIWVENAAMLMGVREYESSRNKIRNLAAQNEAIIAAEAEKFSEHKLQNTFTLQVPTKNYPAMLDALRDMAMVLREKTTWREDLSVSWSSVQARLEAKRVAQKRLQEMLRAQGSKASDILPIQQQLDALYEEMQALQRTTQLLQQKTLYSTITLSIYQDLQQPSTQQANFSEQFTTNAQNGWAHFKSTILQGAKYWVYISIGAVFLLIMVLARRSARRRALREQQQVYAAQQQLIQQTRRTKE